MEQTSAIHAFISRWQASGAAERVITATDLTKGFKSARAGRVEELLQTLVSLGQAREVEAGRYLG